MPNKDFVILQVEEDEEEVKEENIQQNTQNVKKRTSQVDQFVSPIYGTKVKDSDYYPSVSYNNKGRQYDSFRDESKKQITDDYKQYIINTSSNYSNPKTRNDFGGNNQIVEKEEKRSELNDTYNKDQEIVKDNNSNIPSYEDYIKFVQAQQAKQNQAVENETAEENNINEDNNQNNYNQNDYSQYEDTSVNEVEEDALEDTNNAQVFTRSETYKKTEEVSKKDTKQVKPHIEYKAPYQAPPLSILKRKDTSQANDFSGVQKQRDIIDRTLKEFRINGRVVNFTKGPTVTLFEVQLDPGVKYSRIPEIQNNLQGNLEAITIRIEAPIPGKSTVGIEVPNLVRDTVYFGDLICNEEFLNDGNPLNVVLGLDISGAPIYLDIKKMPHGLIAGCTGSGKSVCINGVISTILYKAHPDDVKLILIDPKKVEFSKYRGIPHLATPIITDNNLAAQTLSWAVDEMENRYELFSSVGASNYKEYLEYTHQDKPNIKHIPYIVIIIDEYADLVTAGADVETSVMRLTAKARAAGIHLLVCTQRPSVNVISGTIKTNIPSRIAFKVNKALDSNIILDRAGAEKLLGMGDMLFDEENGRQRRIQGAFISGSEIMEVVSYVKDSINEEFMFTQDDLKKKAQMMQESEDDATRDEMFDSIARYIVDSGNASINNIQKKFSCGFNRVQTIVQKLEDLGVVSENLGSRARNVLVDSDELEEILRNL